MHKAKIETAIGHQLLWNPNPKNRDKVINLNKKFELHDKQNWDEAIDWMAENTIKFRRVFSELIRKK